MTAGAFNMHAVVAATALSALACAHQPATGPSPPVCSDEKVALRIARDDVRQTERAEGTPVRIDETRTANDDGRAAWRFWLFVGEATSQHWAFLYVRKSDCATNWGPFLYEM